MCPRACQSATGSRTPRTTKTGPSKRLRPASPASSGTTQTTEPYSSAANIPGWSDILGLWAPANLRAPTSTWSTSDSATLYRERRRSRNELMRTCRHSSLTRWFDEESRRVRLAAQLQNMSGHDQPGYREFCSTSHTSASENASQALVRHPNYRVDVGVRVVKRCYLRGRVPGRDARQRSHDRRIRR